MNKISLQQEVNDIAQQIDTSNLNRILFIVPESAGDIFLSTSLLSSLKEGYPEFDIYFACKPEFKNILKNNPYIKKVLDYAPIMENQAVMEGTGPWQGLFAISFMVTVLTQRHINYINHGIGKLMFNIRK
jgi:hypothetical protein